MRYAVVVLLAGCGRFAFDPIDDICFAPHRLTNLPYADTLDDGSFLLCTAAQLDQIGQRPDDWASTFVLGRDVDLSDLPGEVAMIGTESQPFTGILDGAGYAVRNLQLDHPIEEHVGLFRVIGGDGRIANVTFDNVSVLGGDVVGGIAGYASTGFTIEDVTVTGEIVGGNYVGGLVGYSDCDPAAECSGFLVQRAHAGPIFISSYANAGGIVGGNYGDLMRPATYIDVSSEGRLVGTEILGGIIGDGQRILVMRAHSSMTIEGELLVGGLVGDHLYGDSRTIDSIATGDVICSGGYCGGAFGFQYAEAIRVQAHGRVTCGDESCGGLSGYMDDGCEQCLATGDVEGTTYVGGLAGWLTPQQNDVVRDCYSTGTVRGIDRVGGLFGSAYGPIERCYTSSIVFGDNEVGGLVGVLDVGAPGGSIRDSFTLSPVTGNSATNTVDALVARIVAGATITNTVYAGTCTNSAGSCTQTGTMMMAASLYSPSTPPLDTWDFTTIWQARSDGPPTLRNVPLP